MTTRQPLAHRAPRRRHPLHASMRPELHVHSCCMHTPRAAACAQLLHACAQSCCMCTAIACAQRACVLRHASASAVVHLDSLAPLPSQPCMLCRHTLSSTPVTTTALLTTPCPVPPLGFGGCALPRLHQSHTAQRFTTCMLPGSAAVCRGHTCQDHTKRQALLEAPRSCHQAQT
jgi:hypothetical protein